MDFVEKIHSYVVPLCQPTGSKLLDNQKLKKELLLNYINFYTLTIALFANLVALALSAAYNWRLFVLYVGLISLMMVSFLLTCRNSPQIYKFTNAFLLTLAGPAALAISKDNLFFGMTTSFIAPSLTLFLFQEKILAYVSFVLQYIFLNMLYLPVYHKLLMTPMLSDLNFINDEQFSAYNFIYLCNTLLLYAIFSVNQDPNSVQMSNQGLFKSQGFLLEKFAHKARSLATNMVNGISVASLEENTLKAKALLANSKICGGVLLCQVGNILDLVKIQTGSIEINYIPSRLTDILERFWISSTSLIKKRNLFGTISIHKSVPAVLLLDQHRLYGVMSSLMLNATRFTEKGNVSVSINWVEREAITDNVFEPIPYDEEEGIGEARASTLNRPSGRGRIEDGPVIMFDTTQTKISDSNPINSQQIVPKKGILKITISDTGCGMSESVAQEIFKGPRQSAEAQGKDGQQIKGLNMWILSQICQQMNAKIRLYSRPGRGTTVIICVKTEVPSVDLLEENPLLSVGEMRSSHKKMRAIMIDDNLCTLDSVKGYLEQGPVEIAFSGRNKDGAMETYEKEFRQGRAIQVIAVNVHNSLEYGKAMCEKIRQFEVSRNMPSSIIILLGECYSDSQKNEVLDPNGEAKINYVVRMPIYLPEFQKLLTSIQTTSIVEPMEPFHPKKVLIVDDSSFNLDLLGRILSKYGYDYLKAENGEKAVDEYKNNWKDIAVVFMDCQMPVMDGYDATRNIRKFQQTKRIPKVKILGVTGNVGSPYDEYCRDAGMNGTITKPFAADDVKRVVAECLYEYQ